MRDAEGLKKAFEEQFGQSPDALFAAPGRTEILGNHTDHQNGEVIAAAIDRETVAATAKTQDGRIRLYAEGYGLFEVVCGDLTAHDEEKETTAALIRGMLAGFAEWSYAGGGFLAYVKSEVPAGSGLSSSASFESLLGIILSDYYNDGRVSAEEIAAIGQFAENRYFGKPCGLMDQMACSVGGLCHMDFADAKKPGIEPIPTNPCDAGYRICITDTRGSHANLSGEYAAVAEEMKQAAQVMGKELLCGTTMDELLAAGPGIRENFGDRAFLRAYHYVTEIRRVQDAVEALQKQEIESFLRQVEASGDSSYRFCQNVYLASEPKKQEIAVALALSKEVLGADGVCRLHGGGFGGTILAFVKEAAVARYRSAMDSFFGEGACMEMNIRTEGARRIE